MWSGISIRTNFLKRLHLFPFWVKIWLPRCALLQPYHLTLKCTLTFCRFAKEYSLAPGRGYGSGVIQVLKKLSSSQLSDVYQPAREQFNGRGSFGNGGAMRVAPFALAFPDLADIKKVWARGHETPGSSTEKSMYHKLCHHLWVKVASWCKCSPIENQKAVINFLGKISAEWKGWRNTHSTNVDGSGGAKQ